MPWTTATLLVLSLAIAACGAGEGPTSDVPTIGMLRVVDDEDHGVFVAELRNQGFAAGDGLVVLPSDPSDLYTDEAAAAAAIDRWLASGVDLVVAFSTPFARMAIERAPGVPVLFLVNDPVAAELVSDPSAPDRGATGVTFQTPGDRTLELARRLFGAETTIGYLAPVGDPAVEGHRRGVVTAAEAAGVRLVEATFDSPEDVGAAVAELVAAGVGAVHIANSTATVRAAEQLREELASAGLPAIANTDVLDFAALIVTPDGAELRRQLARQAARLLSGAPTASVPVEDPRKFVVVIDRGRILELGLPDPDPELLRQADVVR